MIGYTIVFLILSGCIWGLVSSYDPGAEEKRQAIEDEGFKERVLKAINILKKERLL